MSQAPAPATLHPNAVVAVDVVLLTVRAADTVAEAWQVLLVQRDDAAFAGKWSLPGVLVRAEWGPVPRVAAEALALDHADMLRGAVNRVQSRLRYSWLAFQLLPDVFP